MPGVCGADRLGAPPLTPEWTRAYSIGHLIAGATDNIRWPGCFAYPRQIRMCRGLPGPQPARRQAGVSVGIITNVSTSTIKSRTQL